MWDVSSISTVAGKYKIVSFDIFDTLIKRNAGTPTVIFEYVQNEYNARYGAEYFSDFKEKRILAEKTARDEKVGSEVTMAEIYAHLSHPNAQELMELEKETEIRYCVPNLRVVQQYKQCREHGQRVILTSDMYLPKDVIVRMLDKCGVSGYEKLYLSCEIGKKKTSGEIYSYILEDLGVEGREVLHIGDSKTTDNLIPRKKGMGSYYVRRHLRNTDFLPMEDVLNSHTFLLPFINNQLPFYADESVAYRWGYETFGPLLLGFCSWVHRKAVEKGLKKIYFLARDMNLIRQIYEKHYNSEEIVYLEISRRSLRKTYVRKQGSLLSVLDTMTRKPYALEYLLKVLEISEHDIETLKMQYDLSQKVDLHYQKSAWFAEFDRKVMELLTSESDYAEGYLRENGLFDGKDAAIVDIGWHGTIQNMLEGITGCPFYGLYFGITKRSYFHDMNLDGYWFFCQKEEDSYRYISIISLLETMLFAQVGTTVGYRLEEGKYHPVYNACEMVDYSFIGEFQCGAMQFVEDCIRSYGIENHISSQEAVLPFTYLAFTPTRNQVRVLGDLPYEEEKIFQLVQKRKKYKYLLSPLSIIHDYDNSRWKTGYIKWMFPFLHQPNAIEVMVRNRRKLKAHR